MQSLPQHKEWPYAGMLALSVALGIAIAAAVDAWREAEEITAAGLFADAAAALVIAAVIGVFARLTHMHLFEKDPDFAPRRGPNDPLQ